jgi:predicted enzyme related to lactoylglutathione lyase
MGNPVVHFEIWAGELARQKSFYADLFAWETGPETSPFSYSMVDTRAEAGIRGGIREAAPGPRGLTFYVKVDDVDEALVRAQPLGATTAIPATALRKGGRFAVIHDLEGIELGLLEP